MPPPTFKFACRTVPFGAPRLGAALAAALAVAGALAGCGGQPPPSQGESVRGQRDAAAADGGDAPATGHAPLAPHPLRAPAAWAETPYTAPAETPRAGDWFVERAAGSGVDFGYRNGWEGERYTLLETVGGGVAMFDFDQDGDLDLFFAGGGRVDGAADPPVVGLPGALFRNEGGWKFTDVSAAAGLADAGDYSHGCHAADYDNDGFPDLLVTSYGRCKLFHNQGDGCFRDVSRAAGIDFVGWSTAAAWADVDRDGALDLYVAGYCDWKLPASEFCGDQARGLREVCPPQRYPPAPDRLLLGAGDGAFRHAGAQAGLRDQGRALGVLAADLNDDGRVDIYVANDVSANHLYLGQDGFPWKETAAAAGVAYQEFGLPQGSMGVDVADCDRDGLPELFVANFENEHNAFYRGDAPGVWSDVSSPIGLASGSFPWTGFGAALADFSGDGWPDAFVANGSVFYRSPTNPYRQPPLLYINQNGARFRQATDEGGGYFRRRHVGRGCAVGDLDDDGGLDLVVTHQNEPAALLGNRRAPGRWAAARLVGVNSPRDAIGARVVFEQGGAKFTRWQASGAGYLSTSDPRLHQALPASDRSPATDRSSATQPAGASPALQVDPASRADTCRVRVRWPAGGVELFSNLPVNQVHVLVEGQGEKPASAQR